MCDRCQKGFHARCLGVESIGDLPDVWYCRACHAAQKLEATSAAHLNPQPLFAQYRTRNGPFEVLAPNIVALKDLHLPRALARSARQALRDIGEAVTVDDVIVDEPAPPRPSTSCRRRCAPRAHHEAPWLPRVLGGGRKAFCFHPVLDARHYI